jgi:AraC family transcriptional regulator
MHPLTFFKNLSTPDFSPNILRCSLFTEGKDLPQGYGLGKRYVYDYELEFFTHGGGAMFIENKLYSIHKGDIVLRRPGQYVEGIMPYACYLVCFDLTGNSGKTYEDYDFAKPQEFQPYYYNSILDVIPSVFHTPSEEVFLSLFENIFEEFINSSDSSPILIKSLILKLIHELYTDIINIKNHTETLLSSPHYGRLKKVKDYVHGNFDKKIVLEDLAKISGLSATYFHRIFTETFNITPNEYLTNVRMDKSRELLVKTSLPVNTVALMCGFDNIPYFSTVFKNYNHISPIDFRRRHSYI